MRKFLLQLKVPFFHSSRSHSQDTVKRFWFNPTAWHRDVMTSQHDVTKLIIPISAWLETITNQTWGNRKTDLGQSQTRLETITNQTWDNHKPDLRQSQTRLETITNQTWGNHKPDLRWSQTRFEAITNQTWDNHVSLQFRVMIHLQLISQSNWNRSTQVCWPQS